jgi:hypothetical protein
MLCSDYLRGFRLPLMTPQGLSILVTRWSGSAHGSLATTGPTVSAAILDCVSQPSATVGSLDRTLEAAGIIETSAAISQAARLPRSAMNSRRPIRSPRRHSPQGRHHIEIEWRSSG